MALNAQDNCLGVSTDRKNVSSTVLDGQTIDESPSEEHASV